MAGGYATVISGVHSLLGLIQDINRVSSTGFGGPFKKDCSDLGRRIALLSHLLEEVRDFKGDLRSLDQSDSSCLSDLTVVIKASKRLVFAADDFDPKISPEGAAKKIAFQFQCLTWKLERALTNFPYDQLEISEEVKEQVDLVRGQLRRATERYGDSLTSNRLSRALSQPLDKELDTLQAQNRLIGSLHVESTGSINHGGSEKVDIVSTTNSSKDYGSDQMIHRLERRGSSSASSDICVLNNVDTTQTENSSEKNSEENTKTSSPVIPDDFLCPISLEVMRDPVIVATGQTYERSYIQRWIDCGNTKCPKTQQKLQNLTLTPNYVLRSLITQCDVSREIAAIESLVRKLSSRSIEDRRAAVSEIRSLSKRSTENRILIGEAGAIPILVSLLTSDDGITQKNSITSILNLSIYEHNKGLIMLAGAIPSIVQVLRAGSMETKENAAATLFSLSLADENKIIIGASGAIPALVLLFQNGSSRGKKDAAAALFNLCIYQGNKGRAVRAGIIAALLKMLTDTSGCMVDEALTILSVLASHQEAKAAIVQASTIPALIDLLRTGLPRNKEHAAAILLSLCKRDTWNLACISRLGAVIPLTELVKSGTERAKRKATSLLEHLRAQQL
ncbi:RING-type E3 ubiquitin transferase [Heracleum sosnowskyi]|uniref:RING-type E3 ubiquitin transferase n=1 Tax=Heracleum sosnowskyi TaxID=360622 RepID=A0AAD8IQ53_9APIA|nr:RING-type E3 ubiquitin transferase [Heracleum sosnowskyi]